MQDHIDKDSTLDCPVCQGKLFDLKFQTFDHFLSGELFPVIECRNCRMLLTGNLPGPERLPLYYESSDYISHSNVRSGLVNRIYHAARSVMLGFKYRIIRKNLSLSSGSILDIGAGTGHFLHHMQTRGWKISGIEPGENARSFALKTWNIPLLETDRLFTLSQASFDAITLWHVLEHLPDPNRYIDAAAQLLKSNGKLFIAIPNPGSWDAKWYGAYWAAWDLPRHVAHYHPTHLIQLANKHGFKVDKQIGMPLDPFYIAQMSEKYRKSKLRLIRGGIAGVLGWMAGIRNHNKASSIIYICSKAS